MKINIIYYLKVFFSFRLDVAFCFVFCLCLTGFSAKCQNIVSPKGFQAEVLGGINLSQLDGDQLNGFNKLGLKAGFRLNYGLSHNKGLGFSLLYDQRGSRSSIISTGSFNQHISLDYIALPLSFYMDSWESEELQRHKIRFYVSIVPARLLSTSSSHTGFDMALDSFKKWDISVATGLRYAMGKRAAIDLSIERSFLKIYQPISGQNSSLQSYQISIQYVYLLNEL